jgi:hypothetical protein
VKVQLHVFVTSAVDVNDQLHTVAALFQKSLLAYWESNINFKVISTLITILTELSLLPGDDTGLTVIIFSAATAARNEK